MPGICGFVVNENVEPYVDIFPKMVSTLAYGKYDNIITHQEKTIVLGVTGLDEQCSENMYKGSVAIVLLFGYVTLINKNSDRENNYSPARQVYDQYVHIGPSCLDNLNGSYVVAIWDRTTHCLTLSTDRIGTKSLYYTTRGGALFFSSELKALLHIDEISKTYNDEAIADFFSFGQLLGDKTFIQGIESLSPASTLTYKNGKCTKNKYWEIPFADSYPKKSNDYYDDLVYNALSGAIDRIVDPNKDYGIALSGGQDSRWIAALLGKKRPDSLAMTFGVDQCDDIRLASHVAQLTGIKHKMVPLKEEDIIESLREIVNITDGMYNIFHANEYYLALEQSAQTDISVGGVLGDDLFGSGVNPRTFLLNQNKLKTYQYNQLRNNSIGDEALEQLVGKERHLRWKKMAYQSYEDCISDTKFNSPVDLLTYFNVRQIEPRFIFLSQRLKEAYIDQRYPFIDNGVIEAALQLPPSQRFVWRAYRRSFIKHFPDLGNIPWTKSLLPLKSSWVSHSAVFLLQRIVERAPAQMPKQIGGLYLKKKGHSDYDLWLRNELGKYTRSILLGPQANQLGLFNQEHVHKLLEDQVSGRRNLGNFIGLLLTFELWNQMQFGANSPSDL